MNYITKMTKLDTATKINDLSQLHTRAIRDKFEEYWRDGEENARFRRGKHWTKKQEQNHEKEGRIPYSVPVVEGKFATLESRQAQTPFDIIAIPRTEEDELGAAIKTAIFSYLTEVNDLTYAYTEWFKSALIKKYGVLKRNIDYAKNIQGEIVVEKVLYDYFMWDSNCKQYDIARYANWCQEWEFLTRDELKEQYPEKKKLIDEMPEDDNRSGTGGKKITRWYRDEQGLELVKVVTHCQRRYRKKWHVTYNDLTTEWSDKSIEADPQQDETKWETDAVNGMKYPVKVIPRTSEYIEVTKFCVDLDEPLEEYEIDSDLMPYVLLFAGFDDGEIWSLMDLVKAPQKFIDRYTSQIDASLGKLIKSSYGVIWDDLHEEEQKRWNEIQSGLVQGGEVVRFRKTANSQSIFPITQGGTQPELFTVFQLMVSVLEDSLGGRVSQGLAERGSQQQSGRFVAELKEAGFQMAYIYIYHLGKSIKQLGEGLNEDINEVYGNSPERIIDITDDSLDEMIMNAFTQTQIYQKSQMYQGRGYIKLDESNLKILGEAKTRIIIEKGEYSPNAKDRKVMQWNLINQERAVVGLPPVPWSVRINDYGFDPTVKSKMLDMEKQEQAQAQVQAAIREKELQFKGGIEMQKVNLEAMKAIAEGDNKRFDNAFKLMQHNLQQQENGKESKSNNKSS